MIGPAVGRRNCSQSATLLLSEPLDEYVGPETLSALSRPLLKCWTSRAPVSPGDKMIGRPGYAPQDLLKLSITASGQAATLKPRRTAKSR